ncbi:efflux transporter outer membrane subunit [Pseudoduganella umbonata]|uniref:NodT family efflux transporter outer membrane factor (OMF) lipoprotein n=1 Tax=Pseudoduganella umbonata TaxID=864828 RepID=A0A7W5HE38_9BURK|nr:efflux transporter outer membrane subunit [Pseudoduganella umbonata]MBB3223243.1 NodT family efflux transporter outer membrane factor (OMF) lipoprotein [Pseudoduganella umbonata]
MAPNDLATGAALAAAAAPAAQWPAEQWWLAFGDPQLDRLVASALAGNPGLKAAQARVRQAAALADVAGAAAGPQASASAGTTRERFPAHGSAAAPLAGNWAWYNAATLNGSYDLDLWGSHHATLAAALGDARAAAAEAQMARLSLQAAVVRTYIQLWYRHALQDSLAQSLAQRRRILDIVRRRHAAGLASGIDVATVENTLPAGRREHERIGESIAVLRNQLAALVGKGPGDAETIARPAPALRQAAAALPSALPAELLGRRPDIAAMRWRVEAAGRRIDGARAAFYPNLNLVAFAGLQSFGFARFFDASARTLGFTPAFSLPVFEGGRLRSRLAADTAAFDAAVEQYNETVVNALADVANVVAKIQSSAEQGRLAEQALATAARAHALADRAYRAGITDATDALEAQLILLGERDALLRVESERLDNYASLMTALGGGAGMEEGI